MVTSRDSAQLSLDLFADVAATGQPMDSVSGDISYERHHCFIEITRLDVLPRRFLDVVFLIASKGPKGQARYEVSLSFVKFLMRYNSHAYDSLKNAAAEVRQAFVEYSDQLPGEDFTEKNRWSNTAYLSHVEFDKGLVYFEIPSKLLPLVQDPRTCHLLSLRISSRFTRVLARAVYDRCLPYIKDGKTPWYNLQEVQRWCGEVGESLRPFKYFNRSLLKPALAEINKSSDLQVRLRTRGASRAIDNLQFEIKLTEESKARRYAQSSDLELAATLRAFGIAEAKCTELLTGITEEKRLQYKENIAYVEHMMREGDVGNVTGYLLKALKENYQLALKQKENLEIKAARKQPQLALSASHDAAEKKQKEQLTELVNKGKAHYEDATFDEKCMLLATYFKDISGKRQLSLAKMKAEDVNPDNLGKQSSTMGYYLYLFVGGRLNSRSVKRQTEESRAS